MSLITDFHEDLAGLYDSVTGLGTSVTIGTTVVNAFILGYGNAEDGRAQFDYVDVEIRKTDLPVINFRSDTLTIDGVAWKYPKVERGDDFSQVVRWRRNERPVFK